LDCSEFSSGDSLIASPRAKRMRFEGQLYKDYSDEESDDGNAELNDSSAVKLLHSVINKGKNITTASY